MRIKGKGKSILTRQRLPVLGSLFTGLLDEVSGAAAAYSIRLLRADYSGGLVRVRAFDGSSDQGEADVLPDGNNEISLNSPLTNLDSTANGRGVSTLGELVTNSSGTDYDGFVSEWKDQSQNAYHATNGTASEQPKIVSAGNLITENGKAALKYTNLSSNLRTNQNTPLLSQPVTFFGVGRLSYTGSRGSYFHDNNDGSGRRLITYDNGGVQAAIFSVGKTLGGSATTSSERLRTSLFNGSSSKIKENGSLTATGAVGGADLDGIIIGNKNPNSALSTPPDYLKELIFYGGNKINTGEDVKIENNINNFYAIF